MLSSGKFFQVFISILFLNSALFASDTPDCAPAVAAVGTAATPPTDVAAAAVLAKVPSDKVISSLMGDAKEISGDKKKVELGLAMKDFIRELYVAQLPYARQFVEGFFTPDVLREVAIDNPQVRLKIQDRVSNLAKTALGSLPVFESKVLGGVNGKDVAGLAKRTKQSRKWWKQSAERGAAGTDPGMAEGVLELTEYVAQMREIAAKMAPPQSGKFSKEGRGRALAHTVLPVFFKPTKSQFLSVSGNQSLALRNLGEAIQARYDANETVRNLLIEDATTLMANTGVLKERLAAVQALVDETVVFMNSLPEDDRRKVFIQNEFLFHLVAVRSAVAKIIVQNLVAAQKHGVLIGQFNHVQIVGRAAAHAAATGIMAEAGVAYAAGELDGTMQGTMELEELQAGLATATVTHLKQMQANMEKFDAAVTIRVESVRTTLEAISNLRADELKRRSTFIADAEASLPEVVKLIGDANKQADQILLQVGVSAKANEFIEGGGGAKALPSSR